MKAKNNRRVYKVVAHDDALALGANPFSRGDWNRFALVAVRGPFLDRVIAWGMNEDSLQRNADKRNGDIAQLGRMMGNAELEAE